MKNKVKKILVLILIIATVFGFVGCAIVFSYRIATRTKIYYEQLPLHDVDHIAVDSKDNIYIGLSWFSAIQVYDRNGQFLYGIFLNNTPSMFFHFYIDTNDYIHVFSEGRMIEYVFSNKELLNQKNVELKDIEALFDIYERPFVPEYITDSGILYKYNSRDKRVELYDMETEELTQEIVLNAPKWPWPFGVYLVFAFLGMFILSFLLIPKEKLKRWLDPLLEPFIG